MSVRAVSKFLFVPIYASIVCFGANAFPSVPRYEYVDLGLPSDTDSYAHSINNRGDVVGTMGTPGQGSRAFAWHDGTVRLLPGQEGERLSDAWDINESGQIVGYSLATTSHAFVWDYNGHTDWGATTESRGDSLFYGINDAGDIVGRFLKRPVLYANGQITSLPILPNQAFTYGTGRAIDINEGGIIVGNSGRPIHSGTAAMMWANGQAIQLPVPGVSSTANAINDAGQIVGRYDDTTYHAFLLVDGRLTTLGSSYSEGLGINNTGQVVGYSLGAFGVAATLWEGGTESDLNELAPVPDGWRAVQARSINDLGWIAGTASLGPRRRAFLLRPVVPEPTTLGLIAFAVPAALIRRRLRSAC